MITLSRAVTVDAGERPWAQDDPDAGLVAAAKADPRAFGLLYERYREPIYRYCFNRLRRRAAAEEATTDVFLEAFANLRRYPGGPFATWLYTIAAQVVAGCHREQGSGKAAARARPRSGVAALPVPPAELPLMRPMSIWS
jgi:RNA polymerase sigma-70 factor (ECF subfamily)